MSGRVIAVIAGNTNCRLAVFVNGRVDRVLPASSVRMTRVRPLNRTLSSPDRLLSGLSADEAALASVVPRATRPLSRALRTLTGRPPFILTARARTGLTIRYDRRQLGTDRLCVAEGTLWPGATDPGGSRRPDDIVVVDFGTAVTVNFISREGVFEGGLILPGPGLMLSSLGRATARLPGSRIPIRNTARRKTGQPDLCPPFPRTTRAAITAGVLTAVAGGLEQAVNQVEQQTGRRWRLVGTGGNAGLFADRLSRPMIVDPLLGCKGLYRLFLLNRADND